MEVRFKMWIEQNGEHVAGKGGAEILRAIDEEGSIAGASKKLGMSYRFVWGYLRRMERVIGKVVESEKGGSGGGRTILTSKGRELLELYEFYEKIFTKLTNGEFLKIEVEDGEAVLIKL